MSRAKQQFSDAGQVRWPAVKNMIKKYDKGGFYMRLRKAVRDQRGFTLIELLVVITIIAILAAVMVPRVQGYIVKARVSRAMADLAAMKNIVELYYVDEGEDSSYPGGNIIGDVLQAKGIKWGGDDGIKDPWGSPYRYSTGSSNQKFVFQCAGPDKRFDTADDIWCSSESAAVQRGASLDVDPYGWKYSSS